MNTRDKFKVIHQWEYVVEFNKGQFATGMTAHSSLFMFNCCRPTPEECIDHMYQEISDHILNNVNCLENKHS